MLERGSPNHLAYQCPEPRQDQQQNQEEESKKKDDDDINNLFIGCMVVADYTDNDEESYNGDSDEDEESSVDSCLLYTSPSPRDNLPSRMPSSA